MRGLRTLEGACPRCNRYRTRVGCKCTLMPANFPRRDPETGLLIDRTTGEVVTSTRPAPEPAEPREQLALFADAAGPVAAEGLAAARAALIRPRGSSRGFNR